MGIPVHVPTVFHCCHMVAWACFFFCVCACCIPEYQVGAWTPLFLRLLCLSTATWWHGNAGLHALCLPAPSPGDMEVFVCAPAMSQHGNACLQAGHVQPCHVAVAVFYSALVMLHTVPQYGHACSQVMPHGCAGSVDVFIHVPTVSPLCHWAAQALLIACMPSLFKQRHMAE